MAQAFRDLLVWQRSMQLTVAIYGLTKEFPQDERFGLTSQIRRSAVSIPSNIAEGQGRMKPGEFHSFSAWREGPIMKSKPSSNWPKISTWEIARKLKPRRVYRTKSAKCCMPSSNPFLDIPTDN